MSVNNNFRSVRLLGKNSTSLDNIAGNRGEVFYDSTNGTLRVYNSTERGGFKLATRDWTLAEIASAPSSLPPLAGNSGKILTTNGTGVSWLGIAAGSGITLDTSVPGTLTINNAGFNALSDDVSPVLGGNLNTLNGINQYRIVNLPDPINDGEPVTLGYLTFTLSNFGTGGAVGAGALIGTTLAPNVVNSSLTSLGTLTSLTVTGNTTVNSNLTVNGSTTPATEYFRITNGALSPLVKFSVDSSSGNTDIQGTLSVVGDTTLTGNLEADDITAAGNLEVVDIDSSGNITTGNIVANAIATTGSVVIADTVTIQTNGNIDNVANLDSTGNITTTGAVSASGNITSNGSVVGNTASFTNNVTVGGNVSISTVPTQPTDATNKRYVDTKSIALSIALS